MVCVLYPRFRCDQLRVLICSTPMTRNHRGSITYTAALCPHRSLPSIHSTSFLFLNLAVLFTVVVDRFPLSRCSTRPTMRTTVTVCDDTNCIDVLRSTSRDHVATVVVAVTNLVFGSDKSPKTVVNWFRPKLPLVLPVPPT